MGGLITVAGSFCLASGIAKSQDVDDNVVNALAYCGKFFISGAYSLVYLLTGELFPTSVRSTGYSVCNFFARMTSISMPFIVNAGMSALWLPSIVFGSMTLLSALIVMTLPDTTNRKLKLTVENVSDEE